MTSRVGLFYGSSTCYTDIAAEKIRDELGAALVDVFDIAEHSLTLANRYHRLIFGIPTWDYGELQEDWEAAWPALNDIDWSGKSVAIYGLGDQLGYPDWFQDAMGYLWTHIAKSGANMVGFWPSTGYDFRASQALTADGDLFVGLALDEENQFELSEERIARWCTQIRQEFGLA